MGAPIARGEEEQVAEEPSRPWGPHGLDRLDFARGQLKAQFDLIRLGDSKAVFMLRIALALFGAAFIGVPPSAYALRQFATSGPWGQGLAAVLVVLYVVCAALLLSSIFALVSVIRPRIAAVGSEAVAPTAMTFASIARLSADECQALFRDATYDQVVTDVVYQVHRTARIADYKYELLGVAIARMVRGGLVGAVFALILLVAAGWMHSS